MSYSPNIGGNLQKLIQHRKALGFLGAQALLCLVVWNPSVTVLKASAATPSTPVIVESSIPALPLDFVEEVLGKLAPDANAKVLAKYKDKKKPLTDRQLKELLGAVGFEGKSLRTAWAIAKAESNGRPLAWNKNAATGDNSMGIFQVNMLGQLGADRVKKFGLDHPRDLLDPVTNAVVTYYMSKGGTDWSSWTTYGGARFKDWAAQYPLDSVCPAVS